MILRTSTCCLTSLVVLIGLNLAHQRAMSAQRNKPARSTPSVPKLADDAQAEASILMTALFAKCGDSYYYYHYDWHYTMADGDPIRIPEKPSYLSELKGVASSVRPDKLTPADKLNGLEWSGHLNIQCAAGREFRDGRWGPWRDDCGLVTRFAIGLTKRTQKPWEVSRHRDLNWFGKDFPPEPKPKCDALTASFQ